MSEKIKINQPEHNEENKKENGMTRRDFLKKSSLFVLGVVLLRTGFDKSLGEFSEKEEKINEERIKEIKISSELEELEKENNKSMSKITPFGEDNIELSADKLTIDLKNYYKEQYAENPKLRKSFEKAYYEMGVWIEKIEEIFEQENVPKEYAYLAIPESHWILKDSSSKGALGPYQFMPKTAKWLKLKTGLFENEDPNIDERIDPLKSARACARLLRFLYEMSGDWNLTLSGYNGGFFYTYEKEKRNNGEEMSYEDFVKWMEIKVNRERQEVLDMDSFNYTVKEGDKMKNIAKHFGVTVEQICDENKIKNEDYIITGSTLRIPLESMESKRIIFRQKISDISQNLSYPAKFLAIKELIEEGFVSKQRKPIEILDICTVPQIRYVKHKVELKDTLWSISRKYNVRQEDIQRLNNMGDSTIVKWGQKLVIPSSRGVTLRDIAEAYRMELKIVQFCNPDIIDPDKTLPSGVEIRIGKLED